VLPAYDASGANLAVTRIDADGSAPLLVFDEAGKSRTLLHQPGFAKFTIHPDGTNLKQNTNIHANEVHLAWSPDCKRLLFASSRMGFNDETSYMGAPQPYAEVFAMNSDGTHVEQMTDDQWEEGVPAWRPHRSQSAAGTN
jgi:Tol biopolymer transport system component